MSKDTPLQVLKKFWGYETFRPLQLSVIESVMSGKDTLALMPTGGGKSVCFQVPALCMEGICIVVSPLIALMKDQVYHLQQKGIPSIAIHSGMPYRDIDRLLDNCVYGAYKFLYLSPERLTTDIVKERIKKMNVNLLAIDEAHCISQWGYDFRPTYLQIANIREWLPKTPVLALTATATREVVVDIQQKLEFKKDNLFQQGFSRANLSYVVLTEEHKEAKMLDILQKVPGSSVVYVRSRKRTKEIAVFLQSKKINAAFYHAGLSNEERSERQDAWINNKVRVMVSTNAFGMGIDKPDVRTVIHLDLPDSLEAYFQEAGRAGRDGKKSYAVLLYNEGDRNNLEHQFEQSYPEIAEIRQVYQALGSNFQLAIGSGAGETFPFDLVEFSNLFKLNPVKTFHCLKILEQESWIAMSDAVFSPPTLQIILEKEALYDYQLKHKEYEKVIKAILRTYEGAFMNPIHVNENQLARFLNINLSDLVRYFEILDRDGIIEYKPRNDKPLLTFIRERVDARNMTIDYQRYNFLKNRHLFRFAEAIAYANRQICRSQQLLRYFGEENPTPCGICDVCLERNKKTLDTDDYERYKQKLKNLLKRESLSIEQILDAFGSGRHQQVLLAIEFLMDEGQIQKDQNKLTWVK